MAVEQFNIQPEGLPDRTELTHAALMKEWDGYFGEGPNIRQGIVNMPDLPEAHGAAVKYIRCVEEGGVNYSAHMILNVRRDTEVGGKVMQKVVRKSWGFLYTSDGGYYLNPDGSVGTPVYSGQYLTMLDILQNTVDLDAANPRRAHW